MAVYLFSALANDTVVAFVYNGDLWVRVVNGPSEGRSVFLRGISPFEVTRHNITFADGSLLLYGDDALATGDDAPNSLVGGDGGDHLEGFGGDDTLSGGLGDDRMDGGPGISLLIGGAGNDTLDADS